MKLRSRYALWILLAMIAVQLAIIIVSSMRALPPPRPLPPGTFAFGALGDAPYRFPEGVQYDAALEDAAAHPLAFVVHVGDLFDGGCGDALYADRLARLQRVPHPVLYTPGDNDWTDCGATHHALERLRHVRTTFFRTPTESLGARRMTVATQADDAAFAEFVENVRWAAHDVVFATVHVVGSGNAVAGARADAVALAESRRRTAAAAAWVRAAFAEAERRGARAVVLFFHAAAPMETPVSGAREPAYAPFLETLEQAAARWARPVLLVHGDHHEYTVDRPLAERATGRLLANVIRLMVPGSPDVGWVRVVVDPASAEPFSFELRRQPRFKVW